MDTLVKFENVSLIKDGSTLLSGIDWQIRAGERWILFGHNGSGKSLLLQLLTGYLWQSEGTIARFGVTEGLDLRELRKRIGYLGSFVKNRVNPSATVREVTLGGKFASIGLFEDPDEATTARAEELMKLCGCDSLAKRTFGTLSDGEKERALIARSLMPEPELFVLDEPCAGLDIRGREEFLATIEGIAFRYPKLAVVFVTHHADEISPAFGKVLMLRKGGVFRSGTVESLVNSATVSEALDYPVEIEKRGGRYWSRAGEA